MTIKIERKEKQYIFLCIAGHQFTVCIECDKARERRYRRPESAQVYRYEKTRVIGSESRKQYRARHIAYHLARQYAESKRIYIHKGA